MVKTRLKQLKKPHKYHITKIVSLRETDEAHTHIK